MKRFDSRIFMATIRREAGESVQPASLREALCLLNASGEDFVRQAYPLLLCREADPTGLKAYAPRARSLPGRILILASLWLSPERVLLPSWLRACLRLGGQAMRLGRAKPRK